MKTVRFRREDLELFAAASHDRNPLHMSEGYARKTPYGEPVVFGVLGTLAALGGLERREGEILSNVALTFRNPMFVEVDYQLDIREKTPGQVKTSILDAGRVLNSATFKFRAGVVSSGRAAAELDARPLDASAETWTAADLQPGLRFKGTYAPADHDFQALIRRWGLIGKGVSELQVASLLWASYLVGMRLPGERATFSNLRLDFAAETTDERKLLSYQIDVENFDDRFDLLQSSGRLQFGEERFADVKLESFVRRASPVTSTAVLTTLLPPSEKLRGKSALVIGGSRGLGAALVCGLVSQGCDVWLNYRSSTEEAALLKDATRDAPGTITLLQGNADDPEWGRRTRSLLTERSAKLDMLFCNATPPIRPLPFAVDSMERFLGFVRESLALVSLPLAAFLDLLEESGGWAVLISSSYAAPDAHETPADLVHYVAAKQAIEGMARALSAQSPKTRFLLPRPPRLLTDQTNTASAGQGALAVEGVAARIVGRLLQPNSTPGLEILDQFPGS